jgi:electron transfer flavoprotein beta subunit
MGPPQADYALREALAMGADEAILLSDRAFAGSDTWATSLTLAEALKKIGDYTIIFCGRQAIDGDTAQVGPELAQHLDLPQVTYVRKIVAIDEDSITVERVLEDGYEIIEAGLPILLTAVKELNNPRLPTMRGIMEAFDKKAIKVWGIGDIGGDPEKLGLNGSPTQVKRTFTPAGKIAGRIIEGAPRVAVHTLFEELLAKNILKEV